MDANKREFKFQYLCPSVVKKGSQKHRQNNSRSRSLWCSFNP